MRLGRLGLVHPDRRAGRVGYRLRDEGDAEPGVDQFADAAGRCVFRTDVGTKPGAVCRVANTYVSVAALAVVELCFIVSPRVPPLDRRRRRRGARPRGRR